MAIKKGYLGKRKCVTRDLRLTELHGADLSDRLQIYGDGSNEIKKLITQDPSLGEPIDQRLPYTRAEMIWISRNEMPLNLEDILARRTRALFLNARASADIAGEVAGIMAAEMGYGPEWRKDQTESYIKLVQNYI
jgi:glycerol-3-phosphate dehydrogenase